MSRSFDTNNINDECERIDGGSVMPPIPKLKRRELDLEAQIMADIRAALPEYPELELWRNHQHFGSETDAHGNEHRFYAGLGEGTSDYVGILTIEVANAFAPLDEDDRYGIFIAIEVKRPGEVPSSTYIEKLKAMARARDSLNERQSRDLRQALFLERIQVRGGFAAYVTSVDEFREAIERAKRGEHG